VELNFRTFAFNALKSQLLFFGPVHDATALLWVNESLVSTRLQVFGSSPTNGLACVFDNGSIPNPLSPYRYRVRLSELRFAGGRETLWLRHGGFFLPYHLSALREAFLSAAAGCWVWIPLFLCPLFLFFFS